MDKNFNDPLVFQSTNEGFRNFVGSVTLSIGRVVGTESDGIPGVPGV